MKKLVVPCLITYCAAVNACLAVVTLFALLLFARN